MTKPLVLVLFPLVAVAFAVWAQPVEESESSNLARIEAADREFLATLDEPVSTPQPPPSVAVAPAALVAPEPPKAAVVEKSTPIRQPKVAKAATHRRQASIQKSSKKEPTIRRAIPVARENAFTVRSESPGRVVYKRYEFPSRSRSGAVKVTTTTITTRADHDEDDENEDDD